MSQHTWFVTKIQSSFYLMAFIQKVNRTQTLCRSTIVFRYKLCQNYLKEGFVKNNNCVQKKGISFITMKASFIHLKVL